MVKFWTMSFFLFLLSIASCSSCQCFPLSLFPTKTMTNEVKQDGKKRLISFSRLLELDLTTDNHIAGEQRDVSLLVVSPLVSLWHWSSVSSIRVVASSNVSPWSYASSPTWQPRFDIASRLPLTNDPIRWNDGGVSIEVYAMHLVPPYASSCRTVLEYLRKLSDEQVLVDHVQSCVEPCHERYVWRSSMEHGSETVHELD